MFEIKTTDLAGRIGKIKTKRGSLETPCILPVIHPIRQSITPKEIAAIGFKAVMTNAYITLKTLGKIAEERGIHKIVDFNGIIMTDSGGYQILKYGDIEVTPLEMASFQERIGSDIAIVLDTPTGTNVNVERASETVEITYRAAKETLKAVRANRILWIGPIQGGSYIDLLKRSAELTGKMAFDIFALGSPTEVMESYNFNLLAQMIITVKQILPINKPLHLFGAGHPLTIPLIVALGCDLFDSASYILYAREGRYMTDYGTAKLDELTFLPCNCSICTTHTLKEIKGFEVEEKVQKIAIHNLNVLLKEMRTTKQALKDGRIWEYLGTKAKAHPKLWEFFRSLNKNYEFLENGTPLFKPKSIFFSENQDLMRPEVLRYLERFLKDVSIKKKVLLLLPESEVKPFYKSPSYIKLIKGLGGELKKVQVAFLSIPFGIVPVEISDVYPLSQYLSSLELDYKVMKEVVKHVKEFVKRNSFNKIILLNHLKAYNSLFKIISSSLFNCYIIDAIDDTKNSFNSALKKIDDIINSLSQV